MTPEYLAACCYVDDGTLKWRSRPIGHFASPARAKDWNRRYAGRPVCRVVSAVGYLTICIGGTRLQLHRILWCLAYGEWPANHIDHINGNKTDNRLANLRSVTAALNCRNMRLRADNTSGAVGVIWDGRRKKWLARVKIDGRLRHLGQFESFDDAVAMRRSGQRGFGFTERHGQVS